MMFIVPIIHRPLTTSIIRATIPFDNERHGVRRGQPPDGDDDDERYDQQQPDDERLNRENSIHAS